jgi:dipeptidyl aminopeptidase/acylaminoacyl peptidase
VTSFHNLGDYVAIPRVTALRLSPDGSWLAAAVQTAGGEPKKYLTSIWRIAISPDDRPARLTRSAEGEGDPEFLPDGSLLFVSKRPAPLDGPGGDGDVGQDKPGLWLLPAGGGEARRIAAPPGGVGGVAAARGTTLRGTPAVVFAALTLDGAEGTDEDLKRRKARKDAGVTAILHESGPVRYWDHDLGPDSLRLRLGEFDGAETLETRDLTPDPGRALDENSFEATPDGAVVVTGWSVWDKAGNRTTEVDIIDAATGERRVLLAAPDCDFEDPHISPDGRLVACRRVTHDSYEAPGDVTLVVVPLDDGTRAEAVPDARAGLPATKGAGEGRMGRRAGGGGRGAPGGEASRSGGPASARNRLGAGLPGGLLHRRRPGQAAGVPRRPGHRGDHQADR